MKPLTSAALAACLLALAACGGEANEAANNSANATAPEANAAVPADNAAAPEANAANATETAAAGGDGTLSRNFLVGRWTEMDDCADAATEFRADGTFLFPWGDTGRWTLDGDRLTMTGNTDALRLRVVDPDTLEIISPGRTYRSTRC